MSITEDKSVSTETYPYFFPDTDMRVDMVFRRRNRPPIPPNIGMLIERNKRDSKFTDTPIPEATNPTPAQSDAFLEKCKKFVGETQTASTTLDTHSAATSSFTLNASEHQVFRLQEAEINMVAQYAYYDAPNEKDATHITTCPITKPMFGNQCLLSLFQTIDLTIDGQLIERVANPGFSANMDYALRYPHCKSLEKDYEIHGFTSTDPKKYVLPVAGDNKYEDVFDAFNTFDQQGITCKCLVEKRATENGGAYEEGTNEYKRSQINFYTGFISQKIKLSDIFSCVADMPTIFNHKVQIVLQRATHNDIMCNTFTATNKKATFLGFWTFNLAANVYETTNEFTDFARAYYSKPIETVITIKKDVFTPLVQKPTSSGNIFFNLGADPSFKNCLLTLAIPRTTEANGQYNSNIAFFDVNANGIYNSTLNVDNSVVERHYDTFYAPSNSYTSGGLRYLTVSQMGKLLYHFRLEDDGVITGEKTMYRMDKPNTQHNFKVGDKIACANYQDVYIQYLRAREHFDQPECEGLDYNTFIKEYCIFCIDLSKFEIDSNQDLAIDMGLSTWDAKYNPYYTDNVEGQIKNNENGIYRGTQILSNIYCEKVLRLNPNRSVGLYDAITSSSSEVESKLTV